jgi:hypothetical protein
VLARSPLSHALRRFAGDLTDGAASTGGVLPFGDDASAGVIGTLLADENGRAELLDGTLDARIQARSHARERRMSSPCAAG